MTSDETIQNHLFEGIRIGDSASATKTLSRGNIGLFAGLRQLGSVASLCCRTGRVQAVA